MRRETIPGSARDRNGIWLRRRVHQWQIQWVKKKKAALVRQDVSVQSSTDGKPPLQGTGMHDTKEAVKRMGGMSAFVGEYAC